MHRLLVPALLIIGGCKSSLPTRRVEPVTHAERLRPGTAGTVSVLNNSSQAGCRWLRSEPGGPEEEVHQFHVPCADMTLHWSRNGERAVVFFYDLSGNGHSAWEADLVKGSLWEILPPRGESVLTGYISPEGAITLKTALPASRSFLVRAKNAFGIGEACDPGLFRGYRSSQSGTWEHVDDAELDCGGAVVGDWSLGDDFTWSRPGVVEKPDEARGRGDYELLGQQRIGPEGAEPPFSRGRIEFWPAPVLAEWPVQAPDDGGW